jgi:hypothetical protein
VICGFAAVLAESLWLSDSNVNFEAVPPAAEPQELLNEDEKGKAFP